MNLALESATSLPMWSGKVTLKSLLSINFTGNIKETGKPGTTACPQLIKQHHEARFHRYLVILGQTYDISYSKILLRCYDQFTRYLKTIITSSYLMTKAKETCNGM